MLIKSIHMLAKAFVISPSPRRMAAGIALGLSVGLIPKGNLIAIVMMTTMCCLNINLVAALLTVLLVSLVSFYGDPLFHEVGRALLTAQTLEPTWIWMSQQPIVAWSDFNNTVVLGSTITGIILIVPVYWLTLPICRRYVPLISAYVQRWKLIRWLTGASIAERITTASA